MEEKKEVKTNLSKKNKVEVKIKAGGKYSYTYTDLATINEYIESIGETYYQYTERVDNDDYIMTVREKDGAEKKPIRGCRIIQASLDNVNNPAQEQGSALTYARRYSLLMAHGLATEDDDANPDGEGMKVEENKATEKQIKMLKDLIPEEEIPAMLEHFDVEKIEDITLTQASATIKKRIGNK